MNCEVREENGVVVIAFEGRLDVKGAGSAEGEIEGAVGRSKGSVVLNLSGVEYISSSGLRMLVSLLRRLIKEGRKLRLCSLPPSVRRIFEVVELLDMFDIHESEERALRAG